MIPQIFAGDLHRQLESAPSETADGVPHVALSDVTFRDEAEAFGDAAGL